MNYIFITLFIINSYFGSITTEIEPSFVCPEPNGMFQHYICSKYWRCVNNIASEVDCEEPLLWNDTYKVCDWPRNVICPTPITTLPTTTSTTTLPTTTSTTTLPTTTSTTTLPTTTSTTSLPTTTSTTITLPPTITTKETTKQTISTEKMTTTEEELITSASQSTQTTTTTIRTTSQQENHASGIHTFNKRDNVTTL